MKNKELIEKLKTFPENADVYFGDYELNDKKDDLEIYTLFEITSDTIEYKEKVRSCRSSLPSSNSIKENVVVIALD